VIAARSHHGPGLHVAARGGEHAGRTCGAAGLVHALDLLGGDAEVAAERRRLVERLAQLILGREGELTQVGETDEAVADAGLSPLAGVKARRLTDAPELPLPCASPQASRLLPRRRLDLALPDPVALAAVVAQPARGR